MPATRVNRIKSTLEPGDHPYLNGAWTPNYDEYDATGMEVIGEIPPDIDGVYLRNTENPVHEPIGRYHPFDGDGMLHVMSFADGRAEYRNRFVRTSGIVHVIDPDGVFLELVGRIARRGPQPQPDGCPPLEIRMPEPVRP